MSHVWHCKLICVSTSLLISCTLKSSTSYILIAHNYPPYTIIYAVCTVCTILIMKLRYTIVYIADTSVLLCTVLTRVYYCVHC